MNSSDGGEFPKAKDEVSVEDDGEVGVVATNPPASSLDNGVDPVDPVDPNSNVEPMTNHRSSSNITSDSLVNQKPFVGYCNELNTIEALMKSKCDQKVCSHLITCGILPAKGFIINGPANCGKTTAIKMVAEDLNLPIYSIDGIEAFENSQEFNEKLIGVFEKARLNEPSIVLIDRPEHVASIKALNDKSYNVHKTLLLLIDDVKPEENIIIIATTRSIHLINPNLKAKEYLSREINLHRPGLEDRKKILQYYCEKMKLTDDLDLDQIAAQIEGFVGGDIEALCTGVALRTHLPADELTETRTLMKNFQLEITSRTSSTSDRIANNLDQNKIQVEFAEFKTRLGEEIEKIAAKIDEERNENADNYALFYTRNVCRIMLQKSTKLNTYARFCSFIGEKEEDSSSLALWNQFQKDVPLLRKLDQKLAKPRNKKGHPVSK